MKKLNNCFIWKSYSFTRKSILVIQLSLILMFMGASQILASGATSGSPMQQLITGVVREASTGEVIPGVNIVIEGTTIGTLTNTEGKFTLTQPNQNAVIVFSFIGYVTQKVTYTGQTSINVDLAAELTNLDEVVVIGYGTMRRQNFTGSVSTINVTDSPVANVTRTNGLDFLRGLTSGITMSQSGEAGRTPSIQVRGQRSISGGSTPLYVVDGVIFQGGLNNIDPNLIESISVLKDATSLAAYGSQAANGVIMVTTKKGVEGKPMFRLNSYVAFSQPNYRPDMRNAAEYVQLMNARTGLANDADPSWMNALQRENYDAGRITDWYDYITQTGVLQNHSINVSGGTRDMNYLVGASRTDNNNFIKGDEFKRSTFTARITTNVSKYIKVGANLNQAFTTNLGVRPAYGAAVTLTPYGSPTLSDGVTMRRYVDNQETTTLNPLWDVYNGIDNETLGKSTVIGGEVEVKMPWIEGLSYRITGSYTHGSSTALNFTHETNFVNLALGELAYTTPEFDRFLNQANGSQTENKNSSWVLDNILTYTREINNHYINGTLVYTRDSRLNEGIVVTGTDFSAIGNTNLGVYGLPNAATQTISSISNTLRNDVGYLGRITYAFKNTINLNASVRRDGSSVFGNDKKWGVFPAFGAAWTITNHDFMSAINWLDDLKLKVSWGKNGNQSLNPYETLSRMAVGRTGRLPYLFSNTAYWGQTVSTLGNSLLGWETTTSFNYGFESDLLKKRIHLEIDAYKSITTDQIFSRTIPVMTAGITSQQATMGRIDNWGIEAEISTTNIESAFSWNTGLIFSMNKNKLVELYGDGQDDIANSRFLGKSLGAIYGYKWIGIVQAEDVDYIAANGAKAGDAMYANIDGSADGRITATDREILGYNRDNFRMSMSNTFSYKNLELYAMFTGVFGGNGFGLAANNMAYLSYEGYQNRNTLDHPFWTVDNLSDKYPSVGYSDNRFTALESYSFVRLQDINLTYSFDKKLVQKLKLGSLQVYVSGSNLFFLAPNWTGSDPEVRSYSSAQLARTYTFGINLGF
jgi:TonB-linked SusC/RagA family outer membrane protein